MQAVAYRDILDRERPVHRNDTFYYRHPNMSISQRAKIFAPYDALAGFSGEVKKKEIPYEPKRVLDADETWELNRRLNILHELTFNRHAVRINHPTVFQHDLNLPIKSSKWLIQSGVRPRCSTSDEP